MIGASFKMIFFGCLFVFSLASSLRYFWRGFHWMTVYGTVVAHHERTVGAQRVTVIEASYTFNKTSYTSELNDTATPFRCAVGRRVELLVDPKNPAHPLMNDVRQLYISATLSLFAIIGLMFV